MLTSNDDIQDFLKEMYDPDWYDSLYNQTKYAFGEPWNKQSGGSKGGQFPHFADVSAKNLQIGQSRKILGSQFIGLSKVMYNDPEAEYPTLEPMEAEGRKNLLLKRWRDGGWSTEEQCAFMDGDGLGIGYLQHGLMKGPTGKQMITVRHSPTVLTLGDRSERNPYRWRGICFVQYIPADIAISTWGEMKVGSYIQDHYDGVNGQPVKALRVFEYYDTGIAGGSATRALIPGDFGNEPLERKDNPFQGLPFSCYIHFLAPGMRRPIGRIVLSMATQEAINEVEDYQRSTMIGGKGFDIADTTSYESEDLKAVKNGQAPRMVRRKQPRQTGGDWERVTPMEISQTSLARLEYLERRFTAESGQTDFDNGLMAAEKRTLGENQLADQRGQVQGSWSVRQMIQFREQTFETACRHAALFDREPAFIEYFGGQVPVNDPQRPESSAAAFCSMPAHPVISEDAMTYQDTKAKLAQRQAQLETLFPYVQAGIFNARWWGEEMAKAFGEKDMRKALQIPEVLAPEQMMEAQNAGQIPGLNGAAPV